MKNKTYAGLAIRVAVFYFTIAGVCQGIQAQPGIQFRLVHNTLIVVSVMADGEGPFDFVLDTGADTTIVDPSVASKLSLVTAGRVEQTTLAGVQDLTGGSIHSLSVGSARVENLSVLVQDLAELHKMDSHIEGIAGQDFLSHFTYLLDYRRHVVRIELAAEIRDAIEGDRVPLEVRGDRMIVTSEVQSRGRVEAHLLLDSGANSVMLMPGVSQSLDLPTEGNGLEVTSSGQIGLHVGRVNMLKIGSQRFRNIKVAIPAVAPPERIGDGLLPTALFKSLYVNSHEGFVMFNPRNRKS